MSFKNLEKRSGQTAESILDRAETTVMKLSSTLDEHFPSSTSPSELFRLYETTDGTLHKNDALLRGIDETLDGLSSVLDDVSSLEHYVQYRVPRMEDGNNFGVTVQLSALKLLQDLTDRAAKAQSEELTKYYSARADAMDKLAGGFVDRNTKDSTTETVTRTTEEESSSSSNDAMTTDDDDDDDKKKKDTRKTVKEIKSVQTRTVPSSIHVDDYHRVRAVYAVDVQYYCLCQKALRMAIAGYVSALDFCIKNKEKLERPRGKSGGSNFSTMY